MCKYANFKVLRVDNVQKVQVLAEAHKNPKIVKVSACSNNFDYYGKKLTPIELRELLEEISKEDLVAYLSRFKNKKDEDVNNNLLKFVIENGR